MSRSSANRQNWLVWEKKRPLLGHLWTFLQCRSGSSAHFILGDETLVRTKQVEHTWDQSHVHRSSVYLEKLVQSIPNKIFYELVEERYWYLNHTSFHQVYPASCWSNCLTEVFCAMLPCTGVPLDWCVLQLHREHLISSICRLRHPRPMWTRTLMVGHWLHSEICAGSLGLEASDVGLQTVVYCSSRRCVVTLVAIPTSAQISPLPKKL